MSDSEIVIMFDETNVSWTPDPLSNALFIKATMQHMSNLNSVRGHVFLNEVFDALRLPRTAFGQVHGWFYDGAGSAVKHVAELKNKAHYRITFHNLSNILDKLP